jgi:hypothetical protein
MKYSAIALVALLPCVQAGEAAHAADNVVTKSAWMEIMKTAVPNAFCSGKGISRYFRECFTVTEDQCIEEALRAVKVCMLSIADQIPAELHQPEDGRSWGSKLGKCAAEGYELSLIKSRVDSADCKDATKFR